VVFIQVSELSLSHWQKEKEEEAQALEVLDSCHHLWIVFVCDSYYLLMDSHSEQVQIRFASSPEDLYQQQT
jgi:hypothetical protein